MYRQHILKVAVSAAIWVLALTSAQAQLDSSVSPIVTYDEGLLERIRKAAKIIPGNSPISINFTKIAESHRTYASVIEGGSDEPFISARTAFQVLYPSASVMIDTGMDKTVHNFYGFGREEPFWPEKNELVQQALREAGLIIVTHEHGDHIAGVLRSNYRDELAPKTLLTKAQVETLLTNPQLPEIGLASEDSSDYLIVDYERYLPVAPGMVLIKSPGHTPGHQMVYTHLTNNEEYLFIGDIGWLLENVAGPTLRPEVTSERIGENRQALMAQLIWIKQLSDRHGIIVVPSHDNDLLNRYREQGLLGDLK
ncbi:MAG: hypothetical protein VX225_03080 [Pseudomonadota bacterium]|nr:hypothetical protein [Pseudomonadota bacterium]